VSEPLPLTYVVPLRWTSDQGRAELGEYLAWLSERVGELIVVDGSPSDQFDQNAEAFGAVCRHLRPDPALRFAYPKVDGVTTGVRAASRAKLVLADDDVRYREPELRRIVELLEHADLVRPQNYFHPLTWHARWDTARTLLNRVFSGDLAEPAADFPGTLAIRRDSWEATDGYDGDVLFENLELIRTVEAAGGTTASPLDLYVARRPPTTGHFLSQRVRQAYDDFALPLRMTAFLAIAPLAALSAPRRRRALGVAAMSSMVIAELGRRRAGGARYFPLSASLLAPLWIAERAVCSWLAVASRLRHGGVRYGDRLIRRSASPRADLRKRYAEVVLRTERGAGSSTGPLSASKPTSL
jgi:hypothetical protein